MEGCPLDDCVPWLGQDLLGQADGRILGQAQLGGEEDLPPDGGDHPSRCGRCGRIEISLESAWALRETTHARRRLPHKARYGARARSGPSARMGACARAEKGNRQTNLAC